MTTERLRIILETKKAGSGDAQAKRGIDQLKKSVLALGAALGVAKLAKGAAELTKLGAAAERQKASLAGLASSVGQSGAKITDAIQSASDHTINRMDAMAAANKALMMDVAKSPDDFERLTKVATALGRAMGQDATKSMDDFVTAAARQSMMIADNLGLTVSATKAQEAYARQNNIVGRELTDVEKKQAFLNLMLTEGERKMAQMGDTTLDTAGKIEQASAAWDDTKLAAGEALATLAETTGIMDYLSDTAKNVTADLNTMEGTTWNTKAAFESLGGLFKWNSTMGDEYRASLERQAQEEQRANDERRASIIAFEDYSRAIEDAQQAQDDAAYAAMKLQQAEELAAITADNASGRSWAQYQQAMEDTARSEDLAAREALKLEQATKQAAEAAQASAEMMFSQSMTMTDHQRRAAQSAEQYQSDLESATAEHEQKMADIRKKGASWVEKIDVVAEGRRLESAKRGLEKALAAREAFDAETTELTRQLNAKEVEQYQATIAAKETLLANHMDGRVVHQGANVDALLAEEQRRYDQEMAMLQQSRAEQEAEQNRSLGRLVLQHFTAWAQMEGLTAEETLKMQMDISEKYGLIEADAAAHVASMSNDWAGQLRVMRGESLAFTSAVKKHIDSIPSQKTVTINYRTSGGTEAGDERRQGPALTQATGTSFAMGGRTLVGEFGAELVELPRGARVLSDSQTRGALRGGVGGNVTINVTNTIIEPDPERLVRSIEQHLRLKGKTLPSLGG